MSVKQVLNNFKPIASLKERQYFLAYVQLNLQWNLHLRGLFIQTSENGPKDILVAGSSAVNMRNTISRANYKIIMYSESERC